MCVGIGGGEEGGWLMTQSGGGGAEKTLFLSKSAGPVATSL